MFNQFINDLVKELKNELPGFAAQKLMAPLGRKPPTDYLTKNVRPKKSAVLLLIYPDSELLFPKTILIVRPENEGGNHAGQISFPGGGFDSLDSDLSQTALREAEEEIGINRKSVFLIGELTPLYIPISNYMVHPYVGFSKTTPEFKIHIQEVQDLLECNLKELFLKQNKGTIQRSIKTLNKEIEVPCYKINERIIWGATAMILSEFEQIIKRLD